MAGAIQKTMMLDVGTNEMKWIHSALLLLLLASGCTNLLTPSYLRKHDLDITLRPTPPRQGPKLYHSQVFSAGSQPVCYAGTGIAGISKLSLAFSRATLSRSQITVHDVSVQYREHPIQEEWNGCITVPFGGSLRTNITPNVELEAHYKEKCQQHRPHIFPKGRRRPSGKW